MFLQKVFLDLSNFFADIKISELGFKKSQVIGLGELLSLQVSRSGKEICFEDLGEVAHSLVVMVHHDNL